MYMGSEVASEKGVVSRHSCLVSMTDCSIHPMFQTSWNLHVFTFVLLLCLHVDSPISPLHESYFWNYLIIEYCSFTYMYLCAGGLVYYFCVFVHVSTERPLVSVGVRRKSMCVVWRTGWLCWRARTKPSLESWEHWRNFIFLRITRNKQSAPVHTPSPQLLCIVLFITVIIMSIVSLYGSAYETLDTSLFQHFLLCSYFVYYSLPISYVAKQACLCIHVNVLNWDITRQSPRVA